MIKKIHIKNIGIIDDISIDFDKGFNVITGETGSGKTLIIQSLQMLLGEKITKEIIRSGETEAFVEADIFLENKNKEIKIYRHMTKGGKNTYYIDGKNVKANEYKEFMKNTIDIHAQNDNQSMLDVNTHIELLDSYIGDSVRNIKEKYKKYYEEYNYINTELSKSYGDDKEKQRMLDLLNYQINEIDEANLKVDEEEELEQRRKIIMASEKISSSLLEAQNSLSNGIIESLSAVIHSLGKIEEYDPKYSELTEVIRNAYYELEDAESNISSMSKDVEFDEKEQNDIEMRLDIIKSLKRKYGNTIQEILDYKQKMKEEIYDIENLEGYVKKLKTKKESITKEMIFLCEELTSLRKKHSKVLSKKINNELCELEMANAKFSIKIKSNDNNKFNKNGLDKVEFMISTNVGEKEKSLIKIASGGEMSRIMLAIKSIIGQSNELSTTIFDEIDTGISGAAANSTGDKMKKISKTHQVICVTHLAPIAARGDTNYYVYKIIEDKKTKTQVKRLDEESVLEEIARISSGNITDISINHAKELRKMRCA